jgi:hypothetical protein
VRSARHDEFDRVVFDFGADRVPGYAIAYIDRPVRHCASGAVTPLRGDAWLQIRLEPAAAHREDGTATIPAAARVQRVSFPTVKDLALTCDFEADVTWVAGVSSPTDYRVMELTRPNRLVVDVRHR